MQAVFSALLLIAIGLPPSVLAQERGREDEREDHEHMQRDEGRPEGNRPEFGREEDMRREEHGGHWWRQGDIRRFKEGGDLDAWRGGRWTHERHNGRDGWWWVVGNDWYFYPAPVYPYPNPYVPPTAAVPPSAMQAAPSSLYYCRSAGSYYPYIPSCPEGWVQMAPQG